MSQIAERIASQESGPRTDRRLEAHGNRRGFEEEETTTSHPTRQVLDLARGNDRTGHAARDRGTLEDRPLALLKIMAVVKQSALDVLARRRLHRSIIDKGALQPNRGSHCAAVLAHRKPGIILHVVGEADHRGLGGGRHGLEL